MPTAAEWPSATVLLGAKAMFSARFGRLLEKTILGSASLPLRPILRHERECGTVPLGAKYGAAVRTL